MRRQVVKSMVYFYQTESSGDIMKKNQYEYLPDLLLPWYQSHARDLPWRKDTHPYHVWISEIMLQQTRVEAVCGYYKRFVTALPTVQDLAHVDTDCLLKLWEGLGYYNRARNLQKAAQVIVDTYKGEFPQTYAEWLKLPGIGPYTAGAVASISFNQPVAAVDGNVLRVITRVTENSAPIDLQTTKNEIKENLEAVYPKTNCGTFTQALMELGAMVCTPKSPKCGACPLCSICLARAHEKMNELPVKLPKRAKRTEERTVFYLMCGREIALLKRADEGLLSGLWQLPNVEDVLSEEDAVHRLETWNVQPTDLIKTVRATHIFTHIQWNMRCYYFVCSHKSDLFVWADLDSIQETYALPTAFRQFFEND